MRKRTNVAPTHYYSLTIQRTYRRNNRGRVHRLALRGKHKQNFSLIDQRGIPVLLPLSVYSSFSYGKFCLLCPNLASLIRSLNSVVLYHCGDQDAAPVLHFMQHCINYFEFDQRKKNFFLQGTLHIPRPVLTVVQMPEEQNSLDSINLPPTPPSSSPSNELTMSVSGSYIYDRCGTPTRFTLLGESGAITRKNRTTPTTCQLSLTFCTLALLALVGMIVYMEGNFSFICRNLWNLAH